MIGNTFSKIERLAARKKTAALIALLNDRREAVRLAAIRALGSCSDDNAYGFLLPLIADPEASVRKTAVLALSDMNRPAARVHIERQSLVEKDTQVLTAIETALRRFR